MWLIEFGTVNVIFLCCVITKTEQQQEYLEVKNSIYIFCLLKYFWILWEIFRNIKKYLFAALWAFRYFCHFYHQFYNLYVMQILETDTQNSEMNFWWCCQKEIVENCWKLLKIIEKDVEIAWFIYFLMAFLLGFWFFN